MKLETVRLRNFRRFENIEINIDKEETLLVGPNNSGKTSLAAAFRAFLSNRQGFQIYDFAVSKIPDIDNAENLESAFPNIEMELWFSINNVDDNHIEYGRVSDLLLDIGETPERIGIQLVYGVKDIQKLLQDYESVFPEKNKPISHYLSLQGSLNKHFEIAYFALDKINDPKPSILDASTGKRVITSLLRVDFVDAQRNIDDQETSRSNRLSTVFSSFYKDNLEQPDLNNDAIRVVDENNASLTQYFAKIFGDLMSLIRELGVPSINDRDLRIASTIKAETLLQGNTSLFYTDPDLDHELPEAYNGLGYKNLVYMAIQVSHFHLQWIRTSISRPLCQIIFIEEPEAHLHAQVQQTFISKVWAITKKSAEKLSEPNLVPQLMITTHSSHILHTVDFQKVRYFKRCRSSINNAQATKKLHGSEVLNLGEFKPDEDKNKVQNPEGTLKFIKKYIKLTHSDLFFADAAILVEGAVEKLLMTRMIEECAPELGSKYITILEVGGAYAHKLASLLKFIGMPYLIISDLDSVDPSDKRKKCRADTDGSVTSNACIKHFLKPHDISNLIKLERDGRLLDGGIGYLVFQTETSVDRYTEKMLGRTFEETFVYQNIKLFRPESLPEPLTTFNFKFGDKEDFQEDYSHIYETVKLSSTEKTEFAIELLLTDRKWITPDYIRDGLKWLEEKLS